MVKALLNNTVLTHVTNRLRRVRKCTALGLGMAVLLSLFAHNLAAQNQDADQEARLQRIQKNIEALKQELNKTRSTRDDIRSALEKSEKNIIELKEKAKKIEAQIKQSKQTLNQLNRESSELAAKKKTQQHQVSQHIKAAYQLGQQSTIGALLNQQEPANIARNMRYYQYIVNSRAEKIDAFNQTLVRIQTTEQKKQQEQKQLENHHNTLIKQQQKISRQQQRRAQTIAKLEAALTNKKGELSTLEIDRKSLTRLLNQVAGILSDTDLAGNTQKLSKLKGKLPWPTQGSILHRYGSGRIGTNVKWQGLLIGANYGSPVKAVHHGRVIFSDYLRGHGLLIIVDHGADYLSLYAHNESLFKALGDWVSAGETIAKVGNTGGKKTTALYFELRHKGKPQNPSRWLKPA